MGMFGGSSLQRQRAAARLPTRPAGQPIWIAGTSEPVRSAPVLPSLGGSWADRLGFGARQRSR